MASITAAARRAARGWSGADGAGTVDPGPRHPGRHLGPIVGTGVEVDVGAGSSTTLSGDGPRATSDDAGDREGRPGRAGDPPPDRGRHPSGEVRAARSPAARRTPPRVRVRCSVVTRSSPPARAARRVPAQPTRTCRTVPGGGRPAPGRRRWARGPTTRRSMRGTPARRSPCRVGIPGPVPGGQDHDDRPPGPPHLDPLARAGHGPRGAARASAGRDQGGEGDGGGDRAQGTPAPAGGPARPPRGPGRGRPRAGPSSPRGTDAARRATPSSHARAAVVGACSAPRWTAPARPPGRRAGPRSSPGRRPARPGRWPAARPPAPRRTR